MKKRNEIKSQHLKTSRRSRYPQINYPEETDIKPVNISELNVVELIYLGALLSANQAEYYPLISINNTEEQPLAPSLEYLNELVYSLSRNNIIVLSNSSGTSLSALEYVNKLIDVTKITYYANIEFSDKNEIIDKILNPEIDFEENSQQILRIWKGINIEECKAYLHYSLNYVGLPYSVSDRAGLIFEKYVDYFSISQIIGIINRCLGYTTIEYQAGKVNKINAGSYLLGAFINQAEKAVDKKWQLHKYFRPNDLPESHLTSFFFNKVLKLKCAYYDIVPTISELD